MTKDLQNSKRIAKNTFALYIRTLLTLFIGLFTSRVVLNVLGIDDYGIYNVVGGVVSMFNIITASLTQSVSRFITVELGKNDRIKLQKVFCTSVNIMILISIIIILLSETIGLWFLNNKMNIAQNRMYAANFVFQFSIISFIVSLISVPYNATIIAHEKMKAFAYIGVIEAILKLVIVVVLYVSFIDKLITYSFLLLIVSILIRWIYSSYCNKEFEECKYKFIIEKKILGDVFSFAGWNFIISAIYILNTQGINIISNLFFGVGVNAARGITTQVESIIKNFVGNFTTAIRPQITKSYSSGNIDYMSKLIYNGTKYSYFLMLLFSLPIILETDAILKLWLNIYPQYAVDFIRLSLILSLVGLLSDLLFTNILAIGKLRKYMMQEASVSCMIFIVSYFSFKKGYSPVIPYYLFILVYSILIVIRLFFVKKYERFSIRCFFKKTLLPIIITTILALIVPLVLKLLLFPCLINSILVIMVSFFSVCLSVFLFGVDWNERKFIYDKLKQIIFKLKFNRNENI